MARSGGALVGALRVTLGLDSAQFEAGTKRAKQIAKRDAIDIQRTFDGLKTTALTAFAALGGAELIAASKRALDYSDAIADLSDRTGASTKVIQEFRYAAQMSGSDVGTADAALEKFTRTLGLAQSGSQTQAKLFRELGVTSGDFETAFRQTLDGLEKLPSVSERNAVALQIFGKSAGTLTALLGQGTRGYDELAAAARDLGVVLEDSVIRNAGQANDKLDQMKMILDAQFASAIAQNAGAVVTLGNAFMTMTDGVLQAINAIRGWKQIYDTEGLGAALFATGDQAISVTTRQGRANRAEANARRAEANVAEQQRIYRETGGRAGNPTQAQKEAARLRAEANKVFQTELQGVLAERRAARTRAKIGAGDLPAPKASGGRSGSKAKPQRDRSQEYLDRYNDDLDRLTQGELRGRIRLSTSTTERADLELQLIQIEKEAYDRAIDQRFADKELTEAQWRKLKLGNAYNASLEQEIVTRERDEDLAQQDLNLRRASLTIENELLRGASQMARTAAERRAIELKMLDNQYELERLSLEAIILSQTANEDQKREAQRRKDALPALKAQDVAAVNRGTLGPLAEYMDRLPRSAEELNEAYQRVAADGLGSLTDGLADVIAGTRSLGDVFSNVANSIIADLLRIQIQKAITGALSKALGGLFGAGGLTTATAQGGVTDFLNSYTPSSLPDLPRFAKGGSFIAGGMPGIDKNVLSIGGIPHARVSMGERIDVSPANQRGPVVQLVVGEGQMFEPRVTGISGGVSVQTVRQNNQAQAFRQTRRIG